MEYTKTDRIPTNPMAAAAATTFLAIRCPPNRRPVPIDGTSPSRLRLSRVCRTRSSNSGGAEMRGKEFTNVLQSVSP